MLRPAILKSIPRSCVHYSTRITPKEAAGPFTGNNQISRSVPGQFDKTLVYISAYGRRSYTRKRRSIFICSDWARSNGAHAAKIQNGYFGVCRLRAVRCACNWFHDTDSGAHGARMRYGWYRRRESVREREEAGMSERRELFRVGRHGLTQNSSYYYYATAGIACLLPSVVMHMLGGNVVTKLAVHDDIKTVERQRRHPREINNDKLISIETCNILGRFKQTDVPLSAIRDVTIPSSPLHRGQIVWQYKRRTFRLERAVIQADPFLQGLAHRCIRAWERTSKFLATTSIIREEKQGHHLPAFSAVAVVVVVGLFTLHTRIFIK